MKYINELEISLGIEAKKDYLPMQDGDVKATSANTELLEKWIHYKPKTTVKEGIKKFVDWYKNYYENQTANSKEFTINQINKYMKL